MRRQRGRSRPNPPGKWGGGGAHRFLHPVTVPGFSGFLGWWGTAWRGIAVAGPLGGGRAPPGGRLQIQFESGGFARRAHKNVRPSSTPQFSWSFAQNNRPRRTLKAPRRPYPIILGPHGSHQDHMVPSAKRFVLPKIEGPSSGIVGSHKVP